MTQKKIRWWGRIISHRLARKVSEGHTWRELARPYGYLGIQHFKTGNFWLIKAKKKEAKGKEARKQSEQGVAEDRAREVEAAARPCRSLQAMVRTLDFTPNENIWLTYLKRNSQAAVWILVCKGAGAGAGRPVRTLLHLSRWGKIEV